MDVAVVGAGFAGIAAARALRVVGLDVVVYESAPDVGGVWSRTRLYPGVSTQNDKTTYALSHPPMPRSYPEFPTGPQVNDYLASCVSAYGLGPALRLGTEVVAAEQAEGGGWTLSTRTTGGGTDTRHVDHLVVANGVFCRPHVPAWPGREAFEAAGGRVLAPSAVPDVSAARGRRVLVVGYGKSGSDISAPLADVAANTTVVARELVWKIPKRVAGRVPYQYLLLTRLGEDLWPYRRLSGAAKLLNGRADRVRRGLLAGVQAATSRQLRLRQRGLEPHRSLAELVPGRPALVSEGFYERVDDGRITVLRDDDVVGLGVADGAPCAHLASGRTVPADLVVAATGFEQDVPFLPPAVTASLLDGRGAFRLFRSVPPLDVPDLSFIGYNSSLFAPLSAEIGALWLAGLLTGQVTLPPPAEREADVEDFLAWSQELTGGHDSRGTRNSSSSMHNIDELLDDLGLNVSRPVRALQWLLPVRPSSYRTLLPRLRARVLTPAVP